MTTLNPDDLARIMAVGAKTWFELSHWARETDSLMPWQRGLAYSLGRYAGRGTELSARQVKQGLKLLDEATEMGFRP